MYALIYDSRMMILPGSRYDRAMKIATYNVNGISSRLPRLLEWLEKDRPDVACLQELKAPDERFPRWRIRAAGYGAIWHGQKSFNGVAILAKGAAPVERGAGCPAIRTTRTAATSRRAVNGVRRRLPLSAERQSAAGAEVRLQARLVRATHRACAGSLSWRSEPVVLAGDYNVVPTDADIYNPKSWHERRVAAAREPRCVSSACSRRAGPTRSARSIPTSASTRSGISSATAGRATRACASTICCSTRGSRRGCALQASTSGCAGRRARATTRRRGS